MTKKQEDNLQEKYMDGEVLFRKYFEMGDAKSFLRLRNFCVSKGMVSPTGSAPTAMGMWKSMWRWASLKENKDTAWEVYREFNQEVSYEDWVTSMKDKIKKAWQYRTKSRYERFLRDNGWH